MHFVYVLQHDVTKELYIGFTRDLKRRLLEHNDQKNKNFTRRKSGTWHVVYAEVYRNRKDAVIREEKLKSHGTAKHKLYQRIANSLLKD